MSWEMAIVDNDFEDGLLDDNFFYFMYVAGSTILVIIMLNLLIAIISDTFERVFTDKVYAGYRTKAESILEVAIFYSLLSN